MIKRAMPKGERGMKLNDRSIPKGGKRDYMVSAPLNERVGMLSVSTPIYNAIKASPIGKVPTMIKLKKGFK